MPWVHPTNTHTHLPRTEKKHTENYEPTPATCLQPDAAAHFLGASSVSMFLSLGFLTLFIGTVPYANLGVDGGMGPSGTFTNCQAEGKREKPLHLRNERLTLIFKSKTAHKQQCL